MAIINKGRILLEAEPLKAVQELQGMIWRRIVDKSVLPKLEQEHKIITTKLLSGRTVVHIYSEEDPGNGFELVAPDLEDVYFATMAGHIKNRKMEVAL
jgi:ABC-2 type transport system ATP-binding protein